MPTTYKFGALKICRRLSGYTHNNDDAKILGKNTCQCFYIEFNATYKNSDNLDAKKRKLKMSLGLVIHVP